MKQDVCENCGSDDASPEPEANAILCWYCLAELTELIAGEPEPLDDLPGFFSEAWSIRC